MTADEWSQLRLEASRRSNPYLAPYLLAPHVYPPVVPPPRGSWIRNYTERPHLFLGDLSWRPAWEGPTLRTACGYAMSSRRDGSGLSVTARRPAGACRRCLRRA